MLWDELKTDEEIAQSIQKQKEHTAQQLHLAEHQVLALSAQKGLLGKIRGDQALIERFVKAREPMFFPD